MSTVDKTIGEQQDEDLGTTATSHQKKPAIRAESLTQTLITEPPHTLKWLLAEICLTPQTLIAGMMPLLLYLWPQQADMWAC